MSFIWGDYRAQIYETSDYVRSAAANVIKFGSNPAVGNSEEDVWDGGGLYNWITTASALKVSSSSAQDAAAGTGVQQVTIVGLDENWSPMTETVTLTGQTQVTTTNTNWYRVYRAYADGTVGSSGSNVGDIYVYTGAAVAGVPSDLTKVYAKILATHGQTMMAVYSTSILHDEVYSSGYIAVGRGTDDLTAYLKFRVNEGPWRTLRTIDLYRNNFHEQLPVVSPLGDYVDIRASAVSSANSNACSATMCFHQKLK